jgi:hypothetical protein
MWRLKKVAIFIGLREHLQIKTQSLMGTTRFCFSGFQMFPEKPLHWHILEPLHWEYWSWYDSMILDPLYILGISMNIWDLFDTYFEYLRWKDITTNELYLRFGVENGPH